jgi:hypothetical protein
VNQDLFPEFKDPISAASMKIVTFDEEQGKLATFEVRKDRESGLWTIPSRDGYPADAVDQMKDAANALISLKILDVQPVSPEDHDDLGVAEPKLEDLEIGDTGVGRLVTLKDESQQTLAALIIGDEVKDREGQIYVRKPGQDPVYVVALDDSPLTTKFNTWIEDDLLQLSSIDVENMEIKDYNAALGLSGLALTRNYTARISLDGSQWNLDELLVYDPDAPLGEPEKVTPKENEKLNTSKLNDIKNALDDLKIVDVVRKPEGMSANLRADKELVSDNEAVASLAERGFYPASSGASDEVEILSANGELTVGLNDGVEYLMRFGNVSGLTDEEDEAESDDGEESVAGVNRYLLVTTRVDESKFPPPELEPVPQTVKELEAMLAPEEQASDSETKSETSEAVDPDSDQDKDRTSKSEEPNKDEDGKPKADESVDNKPEREETKAEQPDTESNDDGGAKDESPESSAEDSTEDGDAKASASEKPTKASGETETSGSGEATGSGGAQEGPDKSGDSGTDANSDTAAEDTSADSDVKDTSDEETDAAGEKAAAEKASNGDAKSAADDKTPTDEPDQDADQPKSELDELTEEEKQERLEAEQEKITKENQRKIDERKEKLEEARRRVRELNERFADWYYVIPEDTYTKLRIKRSELFETEDEEDSSTNAGPAAGPSFPATLPGN